MTIEGMPTVIHKGRTYQAIIRTPSEMFAVSTHADGCCTNILIIQAIDGLEIAIQNIHGPYEDWLSQRAAKGTFLSSDCTPTKSVSWEQKIDGVPYVIPEMTVKEVPGTSKGVAYQVMAETRHGVVARRGPESSTRLRVCAKPGNTMPHIPQGLTVVNGISTHWDTAKQGSHFAHNAGGYDQMLALTARGIRMLLEAEKQPSWKKD